MRADTAYVELHAASAFSFLRASSLPEALVERAAELEMPALALVDRDGLAGAPRFFKAARAAGIRPLVGASLTLAGGGCLPLLVESRRGYRNLSRLITDMKAEVPKGEGALDLDDPRLEGQVAGLVALPGLDTLGRPPDADRLARLLELFGPKQVALDVQRDRRRGQEAGNQVLLHMGDSLGLTAVATNGVRHARSRGRALLDALTCIREHVTLADAGRRLAENAERHLKSSRQMAGLFRDRPDLLRNTAALAERLEFTLDDLGYRFPDYPLPPGETLASHLRAVTWAGAQDRYRPLHEKARRQIEKELALIEKLDLAGYFLIVWDIVNFCRAEKILAQGRGSAANSAVCYSLGITAVDPVGMELLFERFLSEERGEWPDIDIDLPSGDQREKVIQHVYAKYGARGAAMTANVITYRDKSASRELGKVLGLPTEQIERMSKHMRRFEWKDPNDTLERRLERAGVDATDMRLVHFARLFQEIQDLPRHLGQHSGGMVIARGRLDEVVPLEPASMPGRVIVQWDKEDCADLGIIKIDLLGLGMLAAIEETIELCRTQGHEIDLAHLPPDDPKVYAMLRRADTVGLFQVESRAQMATLPRLKPERFYDLVVEVAIIRPGPIVGKMVHPYLDRRAGREEVTYAHPSLEPILKRTLGVPLFQEQLLRMAMTVAGFSGGEAEELRRAMGFKRSEKRMLDIEGRLRAGMARNGIVGKTADDIVRSIASFALYGFPESHAASFALIAYASAWLRAYHTAAFTCALLNNQPMGFYQPLTLVKDAQRHGVHFRPVDVTRSRWPCSLEGDDVRVGLKYVAGLRKEAGERVVAEREVGAFASLDDLVARCGLRRAELERLAELGALNAFGLTRRSALWQVERAVRPGGELFETEERSHRGTEVTENGKGLSRRHGGTEIRLNGPPRHPERSRGEEERRISPDSREADSPGERAAEPVRGDSSVATSSSSLPQNDGWGGSPLREMGFVERLASDISGTGLTVGPHPMTLYRADLNRRGVQRACDLPKASDGQRVRVAGAVICRQRPGTAKGFMFVTLEDETGLVNVIVRPDMFDRHHAVLVNVGVIEVDGVLQAVDGLTVRATAVRPVGRATVSLPSRNFM